MNETIDLMKKHVSVRNFTDEKIPADVLKEIIEAGQAASTWKNFQSYSIVLVQSDEQKQALFDVQAQKSILGCSAFLVMVGDLNRAQKAVNMYQEEFHPEGVENLLISSVDAALAGQNILLAAESLGYSGVMVGLIREKSKEFSQVLGLPDYTYPVFGIALGKASRVNEVKPRLPYEVVVSDEKYQENTKADIEAYDQVQDEYSNHRFNKWSERIVEQWGKTEDSATLENLKDKKLM
ncbi:nitroreductase family protein [Floricoccus penangensis]|uniref:nitroreductase family protein n=1 Tax=Floricoccus penangensis TaxID=1859475 RepID=UPI00204188FF|nr:nitroreductase family protein [Floricoccus penangensis]URZ87005.1 nitroreductase family protein [Floricoccus penangensis]